MLKMILTLALIGGIFGLVLSRSGDSRRDFFDGAKGGAMIGCGCGCMSVILLLFLLVAVALVGGTV